MALSQYDKIIQSDVDNIYSSFNTFINRYNALTP